jgi:hypothetical protein
MEQNFDYLNKGFSERLENLQSMVPDNVWVRVFKSLDPVVVLCRDFRLLFITIFILSSIFSNIETVAEDQMIIREDLREFLEKQINISACNTPYKDNIVKSASKIPLNMRNTVQSEKLSQCEIPISAITEFKHVLKNGSQLVELVTDLAQTSQISLKTTNPSSMGGNSLRHL